MFLNLVSALGKPLSFLMTLRGCPLLPEPHRGAVWVSLKSFLVLPVLRSWVRTVFLSWNHYFSTSVSLRIRSDELYVPEAENYFNVPSVPPLFRPLLGRMFLLRISNQRNFKSTNWKNRWDSGWSCNPGVETDFCWQFQPYLSGGKSGNSFWGSVLSQKEKNVFCSDHRMKGEWT